MATQTTWGETNTTIWNNHWATSRDSAWDSDLPTKEVSSSSDWTEDDELRSMVEHRELAPGPYTRGSLLGQGGWGDVYKVLRVADGKVFAGKSTRSVPKMRHEARILQTLKHVSCRILFTCFSKSRRLTGGLQEHILRYIDWYEEQDPNATLLVTELCTGGMLQTRINNASHGMTATNTLRVVQQMASALDYLHTRGLFHTDVKPHNILVHTIDPIDVVLADCADVRQVGRAHKTLGTPKYWSPEMAQQRRHVGPTDDVWALGLTMLGMLAQWPRMMYSKEGLKEYPRQCAEHAKTLGELNPGHGIVELLGRMLALNKNERATARDCERTASELMKGIKESSGSEDRLGITTPKNFEPVAFW